MNIPYCWRNIFTFSNPLGKNEKSIQEPSNGGIGIKLNVPKRKLYIEIMPKGAKNESGIGKNLIASAKIMATKKFDAGPARETFNSPHFWSLKL